MAEVKGVILGKALRNCSSNLPFYNESHLIYMLIYRYTLHLTARSRYLLPLSETQPIYKTNLSLKS